jgi:hypothetical protein
VHFPLAGTATESSIGTVTQAHVPAVFTIPPAISTLPPAAVIVKTEDMASILQDTLRRMENMFASTIYQNTHGGALAAYTPPQQYAALPLLPPGPRPEQKCYFDRCPRMIRDCPGTADYINHGLCKRDPTNNQIVLPNNVWIPRWTTGNNINYMTITDRILFLPLSLPLPFHLPLPPVSKMSHCI